jgi:hypothetical protein
MTALHWRKVLALSVVPATVISGARRVSGGGAGGFGVLVLIRCRPIVLTFSTRALRGL